MKKAFLSTVIFGFVVLISGITYADTTWTGTDTTGNAYRTGNVGIGIAPTYGLHVKRDIPNYAFWFENKHATESRGMIIRAGSGEYWSLGVQDKGHVDLFTVKGNGMTYLKGNLGVGTPGPNYNPSSKLEVKAAHGNDGIHLTDNDSTSVRGKFGLNSGHGWLWLWNDSNSETVQIASNGNTFFNGGKVGIGTNAPKQKLSLSGYNGFDGGNDTFYIQQNCYGGGSPKYSSNNQASQIYMADGHIYFKVTEDYQATVDTAVPFIDALKIDRTGKIGVGTETPSHSLSFSNNGFDGGNDTFFIQQNCKGGGAPKYVSNNQASQIYMADGHIYFKVTEAAGSANTDVSFTNAMKIDRTGKVIAQEIEVKSTIAANDLKLKDVEGWADYVFEEDYKLPSLTDVEQHIRENKHLPGIPSVKEVKKNGIAMSDMMARQMQKIEELTLYMIESNKKYKEMKKENLRLTAEKSEMEARLAALEKMMENLAQQ